MVLALASRAGDLPDLPPALPAAHDRPPARAAVGRGAAGHGGPPGPGAALRPARARAHPGGGPARWSRPPGRRCGPRSRARRPCSRPPSGEAEAVAARAEPLDEQVWLESCRTSLAAYFDSRTRVASSRPSGRATSRPCSTPGCCCAASSTGSTSPADGAVRVVDYKTGRSPPPSARREGRALFQMRFYALVLWRSRGVLPAVLQLMYLADGQVLAYRPESRRPAGDRAPRARPVGGGRPGPSAPASGCRTPARRAGGAASPRCARSSAARPPPLPAPSVPGRASGPEGPGDASGEEAVQVGRGQAAQRLAPGTPLALGHGTWLGTTRTRHPAASAEAAPVVSPRWPPRPGGARRAAAPPGGRGPGAACRAGPRRRRPDLERARGQSATTGSTKRRHEAVTRRTAPRLAQGLEQLSRRRAATAGRGSPAR